jgi:nicotinate-nucleotide--dimethylbenzimidazole phosphoribosyltransferase
MSFLNKYHFHIEGVKNLSDNENFIRFQTGGYFTKSSLGHFYPLLERLALIQGQFPIAPLKPSILTFVADHGVSRANTEEQDSHETILHILSKPNFYFLQAEKKTLLNHRIVDLGTFNSDENNSTFWMHRGQGLINARINSGSANFAEYPAMTTAQCEEAFAVGQKLVERELYSGINFLVLNSFGSGDDMAFFALFAALEDKSLLELWQDDSLATHNLKFIEDLSKALRKHPISHDPFTILSFYGSFETAALCGAILKGAEKGIALILNSPMAKVAAIITARINPKVLDYCILGQKGNLKIENNLDLKKEPVFLDLSQTRLKEPINLRSNIQLIQDLIAELGH